MWFVGILIENIDVYCSLTSHVYKLVLVKKYLNIVDIDYKSEGYN